jgi:GT2 family glycosyltransferase
VQASVIICTLNRSEELKRSLRALEAQTGVAPEQVEILVVDNGSTDATPTVVKEFRRYSRYPLRWCVEERLGLSNARNRGVTEARHEVVVFLDDDALPEPGWLAAHLDALGQSGADCIGGRITLAWEAPRPTWLHPSLDPFLGLLDLGEERSSFVFPRNYPNGGNIAFRRAVFDKVGLFDPALGVRPGRAVGSEETDLCYRLEQAGGRLLYEPRAHVKHPVPASKLTKRWFRRRAYHAGRTACLVETKHLGRGSLLRRNLVRLGRRSAPPPAAAPRRETAPLAAKLFLARFRLLFAAGYLAAFIRKS